MTIRKIITELRSSLPAGVTLVAVSKTHPVEAIGEAYNAGQRIFGESRPQELCAKYEQLPKDISWHMIGHLQTNKVKQIAPFVEMIHSVDSQRLLEVINREAIKYGRRIDVLLEVHLADELTKSGFRPSEVEELVGSGRLREMAGARVRGLMTIATNTDNEEIIRGEFNQLKSIFDTLRSNFGEDFDTLSMGMTSDYPIAIECGSTMVRIGSMIFGERDYSQH